MAIEKMILLILESPDKEWYKIYSLIGEFFSVMKKYKEEFHKLAQIYLNDERAERINKNRIKGLVLGEYYKNYEYKKAENLASELMLKKKFQCRPHIH